MKEPWIFKAKVLDLLQDPIEGNYDGIYSLNPNGAVITSMFSSASQAYASQPNWAGHINYKALLDLNALLEKLFRNGFMFSMDDVMQTGYQKMAYYLFGLWAGRKS